MEVLTKLVVVVVDAQKRQAGVIALWCEGGVVELPTLNLERPNLITSRLAAGLLLKEVADMEALNADGTGWVPLVQEKVIEDTSNYQVIIPYSCTVDSDFVRWSKKTVCVMGSDVRETTWANNDIAVVLGVRSL